VTKPRSLPKRRRAQGSKRSNPRALLERVTTLIRANLNELIERAEQPETIIRQIILDMENQLIQVKTQLAISIADQRRSSPDYTRRVRRSPPYPEIAPRRRAMGMCVTPIRMKLRLNIHPILR